MNSLDEVNIEHCVKEDKENFEEDTNENIAVDDVHNSPFINKSYIINKYRQEYLYLNLSSIVKVSFI